jgi:hypothetical protein
MPPGKHGRADDHHEHIPVLIQFDGGWRLEVLAELLVFDKTQIHTLFDFTPARQPRLAAAGGGDKDDYGPFGPPKPRLGENRNLGGDRSKVVFKQVAPDTRALHPSAVPR